MSREMMVSRTMMMGRESMLGREAMLDGKAVVDRRVVGDRGMRRCSHPREQRSIFQFRLVAAHRRNELVTTTI